MRSRSFKLYFLARSTLFFLLLPAFLSGCATKIDWSMPGTPTYFEKISQKVEENGQKRRLENAEKLEKIRKTEFGGRLDRAILDDFFRFRNQKP